MDSEDNAPVCVRVEVHNFDVLCWRCFSVAPCRSHSHRAEAVLQWVWGSLFWFWRSQGLQTSGKGLMGFLQEGYGLPEIVLRMGKRRGFHPRVQGQSWRGKKVEKKLWSAADRHTSAFPMPWGARQAGFSLASPPSHQPAQDTLKALVWAWSVDTAPGTGVQWKMNNRGSDKGQGHSHLTEKPVFTDYSSVFPGVTCGNRPG